MLLDGASADHPILDDPALWSGFAVFETLRTYGRRPFCVARHLDRLAASAAWLDLPMPDRALLGAEIDEAAASLPGESKINVLLTPAHRLVRATPLDMRRVGAPLSVVTRPWTPPPWLPGRVKHTSRAPWLLAARGADEVLWEVDGAWTEANRSNLFVVRGGVLVTPPDDGTILQGVTRDVLLDAARAAGLPVQEERVLAGPCDEMYLCSTLKELAPVEVLDGGKGPGAGPVGRALQAALDQLTRARVAGTPRPS